VAILSQAATEMVESVPPYPVAEVIWLHNVILISKVKDDVQRLWYASNTLEHGWSGAVLTAQIESNLFGRQWKAISNFNGTLVPPQSDLAQQALKDPYYPSRLSTSEFPSGNFNRRSPSTVSQ